jgi:hypothetical protein
LCSTAMSHQRASWEAYDDLWANFRIATTCDDALDQEEIDIWLDPVIKADPLSGSSLDIAKGWLQECSSGHRHSKGSKYLPHFLHEFDDVHEGHLPTRLLDVNFTVSDVSGYTRLLETNGRPLDTRKYIALSHCWGQGGMPFTTTQATYAERLEGFAIDQLPRTFQDAFKITHALGIPYLWIDSLCIIQDDPEDWANEAMGMARVYSGANLVLSADSACSDDEGFLQQRIVRDSILLPTKADDDLIRSTKPLQLALMPAWRRPTKSYAEGHDILADEAISQRAWTMQERLLARRCLHYTGQGMAWECDHVQASESGDAVCLYSTDFQEWGLRIICENMWVGHSVFEVDALHYWAAVEQDSDRLLLRGNAWCSMVEQYSARSITKQDDRLPALSGIVSLVAQKCDDTELYYLAGLWASFLLEGLLWCGAFRDQHSSRPDVYVAPSWSWASLVGPVRFPVYTWFDRVRWQARLNRAKFEPLASYISHSLAPAGPDLSGQLLGGELRLMAPLLRVTDIRQRSSTSIVDPLMWGQPPLPSQYTDMIVALAGDDASTRPTLWVDCGLDVPGPNSPENLFVAFLTRLPHVINEEAGGFMEHRFGLLLQKIVSNATNSATDIEQPLTYRRVGFVDGLLLEEVAYMKLRILSFPLQRRSDVDDANNMPRPNELAPNPIKFGAVQIAII